MLKQLLVFDKLLVIFLVEAEDRVVARGGNVHIAGQGTRRVVLQAGVSGAVGVDISVHDVDEVVLDEDLVVTIINAGLAQKLAIVAVVL